MQFNICVHCTRYISSFFCCWLVFSCDIVVQIIFDRRMWIFFAGCCWCCSFWIFAQAILSHIFRILPIASCIKWIDVKHNVTILDIRIHENIEHKQDQTKTNQSQKPYTKWIGIKFQKKKKICEWYWYPVNFMLCTFSFTFTSMHSHLMWSHLRRRKKNIERNNRPEKSHTFALI